MKKVGAYIIYFEMTSFFDNYLITIVCYILLFTVILNNSSINFQQYVMYYFSNLMLIDLKEKIFLRLIFIVNMDTYRIVEIFRRYQVKNKIKV